MTKEPTHASRIFYFAPYRSIIGQNTGHFRKALGNSALVLEHHADAIQDETLQESILAQTQNWQGVPLIATTMVQFLNTLFAAPRRNARRMPSLANSVLLFDEIQSLPLQHTYLFNIALNLLSQAMGCTIVLCTATQPPLEQLAYPLLFSTPKDIVPDYAKRFEQFKRTEIVPILDHSGFSAESLADFALDKLQTNDSLLVILNTRRMVEAVFDHLKPLLGSDVQLFCLTTHLCPQHRMDVIDAIKAHLDPPHPAQKLICVSTQLIEAGVDLSFDCVIRGMAGLPSVARSGRDACFNELRAAIVTVKRPAARFIWFPAHKTKNIWTPCQIWMRGVVPQNVCFPACLLIQTCSLRPPFRPTTTPIIQKVIRRTRCLLRPGRMDRRSSIF